MRNPSSIASKSVDIDRFNDRHKSVPKVMHSPRIDKMRVRVIKDSAAMAPKSYMDEYQEKQDQRAIIHMKNLERKREVTEELLELTG